MTRVSLRIFAALLFLGLTVPPAFAQDEDDPAAIRIAEPDYTIVNMPTSLRLPKYGSAFRVTHRFGRSLSGDFDDVAGDLFGLDSGATIGLEYRFGIIPNGQIGIHRSSNGKNIEFFGQYSLFRQTAGAPLDLSALVTIEGLDNFQETKTPAVGAILSRTFGDWGAFYFQPIWVNNSSLLPSELVDDNDTVLYGLGARLRIRPTVYLVGEDTPSSGNSPGAPHSAFGIEKRAGGHMFQLSFGNDSASTLGQIARGGGNADDWYMGFHISRKFF